MSTLLPPGRLTETPLPALTPAASTATSTPSASDMTSRFLIPVRPCLQTRSALPADRRPLQEQGKTYPHGQRNATDKACPQLDAPSGGAWFSRSPSPERSTANCRSFEVQDCSAGGLAIGYLAPMLESGAVDQWVKRRRESAPGARSNRRAGPEPVRDPLFSQALGKALGAGEPRRRGRSARRSTRSTCRAPAIYSGSAAGSAPSRTASRRSRTRSTGCGATARPDPQTERPERLGGPVDRLPRRRWHRDPAAADLNSR